MASRARRLLILGLLLLLSASCVYFLLQPSLPAEPTVEHGPQPADRSHRLLYNRVPKCGSTTLLTLLRRLSKSNGFWHIHSHTYDRRLLSRSEQKRLAETLWSTSAPFSYDRHLFFVDFPSLGWPSPVYINLLREPTERIVSSFYYRRSSVAAKARAGAAWLHKSLEQCVLQGDAECTFVPGKPHRWALAVPYFCGHDPRCSLVQATWALERAKENIERSYTVVGVLEDMNATLSLLEKTLPRFFAGAQKVFADLGLHQNRNPAKVPVPPSVHTALQQNLGHEYDLYRFVRRRLYGQLQLGSTN